LYLLPFARTGRTENVLLCTFSLMDNEGYGELRSFSNLRDSLARSQKMITLRYGKLDPGQFAEDTCTSLTASGKSSGLDFGRPNEFTELDWHRQLNASISQSTMYIARLTSNFDLAMTFQY
jgi:hypothetical protein